jgi:hypothetical protein
MKIGDKVLINPKSIYANQAKGAHYGIVVSVNVYTRLPYRVSWKSSNGRETNKNTYGAYDLLPYQIVEKGDTIISSEGIFTVVEILDRMILVYREVLVQEGLLTQEGFYLPKEDLNVKYFKIET